MQLGSQSALPPLPADDQETVQLEVLACAPSLWDLIAPPGRHPTPRIPGGVLVGREEGSDRLLACGGFLPCGTCGPCQSGLQLACAAPLRPGWNAPGGLSARISLPRRFLAPGLGEQDDLEGVVLILALAGTTYQAVASADMAPGDTVLLFGDIGPGALPLAVLQALGLRPLHLQSPGSEKELESAASCRVHILDMTPSEGSVQRWIHLAPSCLSCTLLGPGSLDGTFALNQLLGGQCTLRWIRDLHPHLLLDLAALVLSDRVTSRTASTSPLGWEAFCQAFDAIAAGTGESWPVLMPLLTH